MKFLFLSLVALVIAAGPGEKNDPGIYVPTGKRDPFRGPTLNQVRQPAAVSELERYNVEQYQLRAVLKGMGKPKAMFEDPEGKTHILKEGDVLGRARATISRILKKEVILTERTFNYLGAESLTEKVLSLPEAQAMETASLPVTPAETKLPAGPLIAPDVNLTPDVPKVEVIP